MKILAIGFHGLLGGHLLNGLRGGDFGSAAIHTPTRQELDVVGPDAGVRRYLDEDYDLVILAAAYTDVAGAEREKQRCFATNVQGAINVATLFQGIPLVYVSSEYAHNPVNYYGQTKLAAEVAVKALAPSHLIVRTLFKANPFPYPRAFGDQWTQGDYVDVVAPLLAGQIAGWDGAGRTVYTGTGRKTMLELARRTRPEIEACSVADVTDVRLPRDYE
jgi:dTDP-4-dehydrorhamnose reductase